MAKADMERIYREVRNRAWTCALCERVLSPDGHCRNGDCDRYDSEPDHVPEPEWDEGFMGVER